MTVIPPRPRQTSRYYAPGVIIGGKYELVRPLGEGGMGSVWLAKNSALDSDVALKLLRADLDADDAGERLLQEARAAARLGHRAIVRVFDFGHTDQGDPFIVMELLEGESLADVLATRGRLSPIKAVQMLLPVIDALAVAHSRGIVHRDLKPENVFLVREPRRTQPKVVDFGIAKVEQAAGRSLTLQGTVLGSPGYMSPEQARGHAGIDHRSDIWAMCVVIYECITGQPAFNGENYNSLMRAIIEDPVVPSVDLAAGDAALWEILERGLRKDKHERWNSMRELGAALAGWLVQHAVDQDVCGEPLTSWLEATESSRSRDILSVPPPSMALAGRRTPSDLVHTLTETPDRLSPVSGRPGGVGSFRPAPESTSAVVHTPAPPRIGHTPLLAIAAVALIGIGVSAMVLMRRGDASEAPSAGAPPAASVFHAVPPTAHAKVDVPAQPASPAVVPPVQPAPAPAAAASPRAAVKPEVPRGASSPARPGAAPVSPKAQKRPVDVAPSGKADLKDPY